MPSLLPVFGCRFVVTIVDFEVRMAGGKFTHEIPEGVHSSVQSAMNEKDFAIRLSFEHALQAC